MENCPKCGKEIATADIEGKRAYCSSCREWFARKEDAPENPPKKDESRLNNETAEKSIQKERHIIVSIWLWVGIIANLLPVIIILFFDGRILGVRIYNFSNTTVAVVSVLLGIAIIIGNIFVLKWKIIGLCINIVAIVYMYSVLVMDDPYLYFYYMRIPTILPGILSLSIHFGILNIRKNGVSTWRHLLNEAKANKRKNKIWFTTVFGSIFVALIIFIFPVKIIYGNIIVMFAPDRINLKYQSYNGRVLGSHVLKTEYGEIKLGFLANLFVSGYRDELGIYNDVFEDRRGSHNLVVAGIRIPNIISLWLNIGSTRTEIAMLGVLHGQNLYLSGVPFRQDERGWIRTNKYDVTIPIVFVNEYIMLSDSTQIDVENFTGELRISDGQWKLTVSGGWFNFLWVMLPGETEFTRYKSITFKENWGAFIQGDVSD